MVFSEDQIEKSIKLRESARIYAKTVQELVPVGRERDFAIVLIQVASMLVAQAIAINEAIVD